MKGGTQLRQTSGVVYVYGLKSERSVVLVFGLLVEKKYLTG